jgi:hypothetical protein
MSSFEPRHKQDDVKCERRIREAGLARERHAAADTERQRRLGFRFLVSAIIAGVLAVASGLAPWANNAGQTAA